MPEHWATEDDGYLRLCVAKGTLVPAKTLRCGHPQASRTLDLLLSLCLNPNSNPRTHPNPTATATATATTTHTRAHTPPMPQPPSPPTLSPQPSHP